MNQSLGYKERLQLALMTRTTGTVITEAGFMILITVGALAGNLTVCLVIWKSSQLHTLTNLYILCLGVSNISMACSCMVLSTDVLVQGQWRFSELTCHIFGFLFLVLGFGNLQMNGLIAVNRYFCVVKPNLYRKYFKRINYAWGMVILLWVCSFVTVTMAILIPLLKFVFRPDRSICFAEFRSATVDAVFSVVMSLFYIIGPLTVMIVSYCEIHKVLKHHNTSITHHGENTTRLCSEETRITKVLCVLVSGYILCMLPVIVIHYIDIFYPHFMSRQTQMMYSYFYFLNNGIHPILYGVLNKPFRVQFRRIFLTCRSRNKVQHQLPDAEPGTSNLAINSPNFKQSRYM